MCRQALERRVSFGPPLICSWSDCPRREKRYTDTKAHSYSHWTGGRPRCLPQGEPPACSRRGLDVILSGLLAAATWVWFGWYGERSSTGPRRTDERSRRDRGGNDARKRFWRYCGTVVEDLFFFLFPSSSTWNDTVRGGRQKWTGHRDRKTDRSYPPPDLKDKWKLSNY